MSPADLLTDDAWQKKVAEDSKKYLDKSGRFQNNQSKLRDQIQAISRKLKRSTQDYYKKKPKEYYALRTGLQAEMLSSRLIGGA